METDLPEPEPGQVLVRNTIMSVDPYMRSRMDDVKSYVPPYRLGEALDGGAIGEVLTSRAPGVGTGDLVLHRMGWREHALLGPGGLRRLVPAADIAPSAYLGVLGMPGLTAFVGLLDIGALSPGDVVFISGAAGAVGAVAGQIAKLRGHQVIGSAGSPEKVAHLRERLGFEAFSYRERPIADSLAEAAPDGIDLYFDNVGGEHLEAALGALRTGGRVALCGAVSQYNAMEPSPGPRNLIEVVRKRLTLRGFLVGDHGDRREAMEQELGLALRERRLTADETVVEGLDGAPQALIELLRGKNVGKMLVRL